MATKPVGLVPLVIIHSLTKWLGGHGVAIGGAVVDGGNFDWGQMTNSPLSLGHIMQWMASISMKNLDHAFTAKFRAEGMYNFEHIIITNQCVSYFARHGNIVASRNAI